MNYINSGQIPIIIISISDNDLDVGDNLNQVKSESTLQHYIFIHAEKHEQVLSLIKKEAGIGGVIINIGSSLKVSDCNVFIKNIRLC